MRTTKKPATNQTFKCKQCSMTFIEEVDLKFHIAQHLCRLPKQPIDMNTTTEYIDNVKAINYLDPTYEAVSLQTEDPKLTFPCPLWGCGRSFKTFRGQKRHETHCANEASNTDDLKCGVDKCKKVFTRKFRADSHRLTHLKTKKKEELKCQQCKTQCTQTRILLHHKAIYTKGISYQCKYCIEKFCYKHHLDRHTNSKHHEERQPSSIS